MVLVNLNHNKLLRDLSLADLALSDIFLLFKGIKAGWFCSLEVEVEMVSMSQRGFNDDVCTGAMRPPWDTLDVQVSPLALEAEA